jgi:uncharacterized protein
VPVFLSGLNALRITLDKAAAHVRDHKLSETAFLESRLIDDMLPLKRQVMISTDHVKSTLHRLAGTEMPSWPDVEKTFAELQERVQKAMDLAKSFSEKDLESAENRLCAALRVPEFLVPRHDRLFHMPRERCATWQTELSGARIAF